MPSDAAKKRQAQKREQRKQASSRAAQKKAHVPPGPGPDASNSSGGSAEGIEKKPVSDGARASNDSSVSVTKLTDRAAALKVTQTARSCTGKIFVTPDQCW